MQDQDAAQADRDAGLDAVDAVAEMLAMWPEDVVTGESGDPGPSAIVKVRQALPALRALVEERDRLAEQLRLANVDALSESVSSDTARMEAEMAHEARYKAERERDAARAELAALAERVEAVVPYVVATLPRGGWTEPIGDEWGRAHLGRSSSSIRQLEDLVQAARAALPEGADR